MTKLVDLISAEVSAAFAAAGFDAAYGKVTVSNRPDLCEFQCNGSLPAAKQYKAAPIKIAQAVAQGGSFQDCMKAVAKGVGGSISDLEAYRRAASFYFDGAKVQFTMSIQLTPAEPEESRSGILLDLSNFF